MDPKHDFFIGWEKTTPRVDRRFLLGASAALLAGAGGLSWALSKAHGEPGPGMWDQATPVEVAGTLLMAPYPAIVSVAADGTRRTTLLAGTGKDSVRLRMAKWSGSIRARGTIVERGGRTMLVLEDGDGAILDAGQPDASFAPATRSLGPASYVGEILDAKCWFGAMRPNSGKTHKSCASLCVRGRLPVLFCDEGLRCSGDGSPPLLLNELGEPHDERLLPLVADPVFATGELVQVDDLVQFRVALTGIRRL